MSLWERTSACTNRLYYWAGGLFRSYAEIFFLADVWVGGVLFLSTLLKPNVGLSGLIAVLAARGFARLVHLEGRFIYSGIYTYNPLLVGLCIGGAMSLSWHALFLLVSASVLTFLLTVSMVQVLRNYLNLPALSLPFVVASVIVYLASLRYSNLMIQQEESAWLLGQTYGLPGVMTGFLRSLGAIFLMPSELIGLLFSIVIAFRSRILFGLAMWGYLVGTLLRSTLTGSFDRACADVNSFNFILIAMALGGVFLVPSWQSWLIATASVAVSALVLDAAQVLSSQYGLPAYTLPFNLVTLGVLYVLTSNHYPLVVQYFGATPEDTLENDLVGRTRFPGTHRTLELPFFGKWMVWQAFNDEWTHKGAWQFAYDFVIADEEGRLHADSGLQLKDYYCFRKPVLSPCRGRVVKVVNDLPDNPIGRVDKANNWGNHIVIYDERGFFVELSHFAEGSIKVEVGNWVESGQHLGLCGNSGYSPQPHLHIHVQLGEALGSPTLPFSFIRYWHGHAYHANDLPRKGAHVERAVIDAKLDRATDFLLNEQLTFNVREEGLERDPWTVWVQMALDGTLCWETARGDRLYFGKSAGTFYCYRREGRDRYLGLIWSLLPRLPLVRRERMSWTDVLPLGLVLSGPRRMISHLLVPFLPQAGLARATHRYSQRYEIETTISIPVWNMQRQGTVLLDAEHGFAGFRLGDLELTLQRPTAPPNEVPPTDDYVALPASNASAAEATSSSPVVALQSSE